jgi:hypothetical protein
LDRDCLGEMKMAIEWWVVLATLAGPVVAVQTQKWIERATESKRRRRWIFDVMMANRATRIADEHVKALNMIDLEFRSKKDKHVTDAWRALFGELTQGIRDGETDQIIVTAWNRRCDDLYVSLLSAMSRRLGFGFNEEDLRRGIYYPRGHSERENAQLAILHGLRSIFQGGALPVEIKAAPASPEAAALQVQLTEKMVTAYDQDGALKVRILAQ